MAEIKTVNTKVLKEKLTPEALCMLETWVKGESVDIKVSSSRRSKLGDYSFVNGQHRITVNQELDFSLFFFTLTHEIAHQKVKVLYGNKVRPHGQEWKRMFSALLDESLSLYPIPFQSILTAYKKNPKANLYSFPALAAYYNQMQYPGKRLLDSLSVGDTFRLKRDVFVVIEKRKIRYLCKSMKNGKQYWINQKAVIDEVENEK